MADKRPTPEERNMLTKIKTLLGNRTPPTLGQLREAADALTAELTTAQAELAALLARRDEDVLAALVAGESGAVDSLRERITRAEQRVSELQAAHSAASARIASTVHRSDEKALARRWDEARQLVERRNNLGATIQGALTTVAQALNEVRTLENEIIKALPVQPKYAPTHWGQSAHERLVLRHLAAFTENMFAAARGFDAPCEIRQQPQIGDRYRASGDEILSGLNSSKPKAA